MGKSLIKSLIVGSLLVPTISFGQTPLADRGVDDIEILTASAGDYVRSVGREISDYSLKSLRSIGGVGKCFDGMSIEAYNVSAEVVTDFFAYSAGTDNVYCFGTALIPKN